MPHRLRRVFGVNLRTPKDDGTSSCIVEMDTRGAVMALGGNGVGKTSFLRMIPLFYGATPSSILRGSGHEHMMRHMLPDASSCIVFEYERETEEDLRCAVVHCAPDKDAPVYHIIRGSFDEEIFTRQDGDGWVFLNRDEFRAKAEAMGRQVTPAMDPAQYRCVILGDRAETRDMVRFRRLATEHSLAPRSLRGLEQIAAAMGPEALSFGTLQGIVVGRVNARMGAEGKAVLELKKPARDVLSWIASHEHLSRVQAKADDARALSARCAELQTLDFELRGLRVAAQTLADTTATAAEANRTRRERLQAEAGERQAELDKAASRAGAAEQTAADAVDRLAREVRAIKDREAYFNSIHVQALAAEQDKEAALLDDQGHLTSEKNRLEAAAKGIVESFQNQRSERQGEHATVSLRVAGAMAKASSALTGRLEQIRLQQEQALEQVKEPPRLAEVSDELGKLATREGQLQAQAANPSASQQTQAAWSAASQQLRSARPSVRQAAAASAEAEKKVRQAQAARDQAAAAHGAASDRVSQLQQQLRSLEEQRKPKEGTLLAFLREGAPADLGAIAKALNPDLVARTDLQPQIEDLDAPSPGPIRVGSLLLDVTPAPAPDWLDERELQSRIEQAKLAIKDARDRLAPAEKAARDAAAALEVAQADAARCEAARIAADQELERLEQAEALARQAVEDEQHARAEDAKAQLASHQEEVARLQAERKQLLQSMADMRAAIARQHDAMRQNAADSAKADQERFKAEQRQADARLDQQLKELDEREGRELRGANVDAARIAELDRQIKALGARLKAIAGKRHEVTSWREFCAGELASLKMRELALEQARQSHGSARQLALDAQDAARQHAEAAKQALEELDAAHQRLLDDRTFLQGLLNRELRAIAAAPAGTRVSTWSVPELIEEVQRKTRALTEATDAASSLASGIRRVMLATPGAATAWLERKDAELPAVQDIAQHEDVLRRSRMLCEWYESDFVDPINALHQELAAVFGHARTFVRDLEAFDLEIGRFNSQLQGELGKVTRFPNFSNLTVAVRSTVRSLEYMGDLQKMRDMADSRVSFSRAPGAAAARELGLPSTEEVELMKSFKNLLQREGGIRANVNELVRLEFSVQIKGRQQTISREDEFKRYASTGNTGMIVAMFLMGFAGMVRRDAGAKVRLTWVTDECGRFDGANLRAFLQTLDENDIDVISATPEAPGGSAEMFDRLCRFYPSGAIRTAQCEELHVV